ncbi:MAG TPA: hypothetical protein ENH78_09145, partial [Phycisphaerae bacterium]|nr:hypothetical protein [Phycisphaerae bacterium]
MEFIRQHLVLIIVGVAVVVIGGLLLTANMSLDDNIQAAVKERENLGNKLRNLYRRPINQEIVDAEEQRVESVKAGLEQVINDSTKWNSRNLEVLAATVVDETGEQETIHAFPIDRAVYTQWGMHLKYNLTTSYIERLKAMLEPLKAATPATEEDVDDAVPVWINNLRATDEWRAAKPDDPALVKQARMAARDAVRQESVRDKLIYADASALDFVFTQPTTDATEKQLWQAQLNLWVTRDVLAAIGKTNDAAITALQQGDPDKTITPSVAQSAVRRLWKLSVFGYTSSAVAAAAPAAGVITAGAEEGPPKRATLTERSASKLYDVVYYQFIVTLPLRHVGELERTLTSINYHTILSVDMQEEVQMPQDLYYYGPDPVLRVTFKCELLLLASWERGSWDAQAKAWSADRPPLMPVSVLRTLP